MCELQWLGQETSKIDNKACCWGCFVITMEKSVN